MAPPGGSAAHTVEQRLLENPRLFGFFHAVRMLEAARGGAPRIGLSDHPREDAVRFCQEPSLAFQGSAINRFLPAEDDRPARLFVSFLGLLGTNGPLPLSVTEYVYDRVHNAHDETLARFLDMFNHRMISMLYRAWAASNQPTTRDNDEDRSYDRYVGSLFGVGMESFRGVDRVPDDAKLHYAGHLSCETRHPEGLAAMVSHFFGVDAQIIEYVGRWLKIPTDCLCRIGGRSENARLGITTLLGRSFWECQQKFRIRIGPMGLAEFERLLPHTESFRRLVDLVRNYVGDELLCDVQLVLRAADVPRTRLGSYGQLGRTSWLRTKPFERDAEDVIIHESIFEALKR